MALYAKIACDLTRDPRMLEAGPLARLLYIQAVLFARENLTDGVIDARLLGHVAVDIPRPRRHIDRMVAFGLLEEVAEGWRIPERVWRKYNPTKAEVDDLRETEKNRKAVWRDKVRDTTATEMSHRDKKVACPVRDGQPEPEPEPEPEVEKPTPLPPGGGGGSLPNVNPNINRAIELLVDAEQAKAGTLTNPTGWRRIVHRRLETERLDDLEHLAVEHPDWTPEQLAATNGHRQQVFHQADLEPVDHAKALQNLRAAREATGQ